MNAAMDTDEEESQSASGDTVDSDQHHMQALGDSHPSSGGTADKGVYSGEEVAPDSSLGSHRPTQGLTLESMNQGSSTAAREDNSEATDPADDLDDRTLVTVESYPKNSHHSRSHSRGHPCWRRRRDAGGMSLTDACTLKTMANAQLTAVCVRGLTNRNS
jgi:hypothetical protein